jgi:hypothetical protein
VKFSEIDFFGISSYFESQKGKYILIDSAIHNVLVSKDVFSYFKDNFITTSCFKADEFLNYPSSNYLCYCDGGIPPGFPELNFIMDNNIFTLDSKDYIHIPFVNNITRRSYCELGV